MIGVIAWMHTFSPAKMWIAGLDALRKPLLHLHTQANVELPWADIDFDFMNLNQAAHGDREFGYIQTRLGVARKTVVGHVSNPAVSRQVDDWQRAAAGWAAVRTLKLARFGDNMRYVAVTEGDKTEAELRFGVQVNTWGVNELADAVHGAAEADVDALVAEYERLYDVAPELLPGGERHESLRDGAAIELGLRSFLEAGGFGAFTTNFEDLGALKQLPGLAVQRLMAEGYGFGAEGDWKTAILVRVANVMGAGPARRREPDGGLHLRPRPGPGADPRRAHARGLPVADRQQTRASRSTRSASAARTTRCAWSSRRPRPRRRGRDVRHARPVPPRGQRRRRRGPDGALPKLPVGRAVWKPAPDFATSAAAGWPPAPPTTPS